MKEVDILLVEDDPTLQRALVRVLSGAGYAVSPHLDAESMLVELDQKLEQGHRLCVLLDVNLGGINGVDAQKLIRQREADIPVVFTSAEQDARHVNQAWRDGAANFLFKPFTPKELLDTLEEALRRPARPAGTLAPAVPPAELQARVARLTHRQRQVLVLIAQGMTHEQVAARIGISARTVKLHRAALMVRLQCKHLADLVRVHDACQALLADTPLQSPA